MVGVLVVGEGRGGSNLVKCPFGGCFSALHGHCLLFWCGTSGFRLRILGRVSDFRFRITGCGTGTHTFVSRNSRLDSSEEAEKKSPELRPSPFTRGSLSRRIREESQ
jgi:hypothetical protein